MSTLMSTDMNLKRSSTRVHAPPGGATTISFGGYSEDKPAAPAKAAPSAPPATPAKEAPAPAIPAPAPIEIPVVVEVKTNETTGTKKHQVGVTIVEGPGSDAFVEFTKQSFADAGVTKLVFLDVADALLLPYAAQSLIAVCDVVVAGAVLVHDKIGEHGGALAQSLVASITQLGLLSHSCVIPAIVSQTSLLEAKAVMPLFAANWAKLAKSALGMKAGSISVHPTETAPMPAPPVVTAATTSAEDLMAAFRATLKARGAHGICGISKKFRIADDDNSGTITLPEFEKMISEHALGWTADQVKLMFAHFDKDKSGSIVFDEFLRAIRGSLNERRRQIVLTAFEVMDADKSGVIELNDVKGRYDASKHPDVIANKRTADEVLREFLDTFDGPVKDGKITAAEFCEYYSNVSASIDHDDYFELMIRNAWHISGGEGWCANSSCRRVLVTHADGRQTVEEIKNDLGIGANDKDKMKENLIAQGIADITLIDTTGNVEAETPAAAAKQAAPASGAQVAAGGVAVQRQHRRIKGGESTLVLG